MEEEEALEFIHTADHFVVDDLLVDFSNDDEEDNDVVVDSNTTTTITDGSYFSSADLPSFNGDTSFSPDLCVPCDDLAELEWLSNFVEESFSTEDVHKLQLKSGFKTLLDAKSNSENPENSNSSSSIFTTDVSVPTKARSKRSRAPACNWASHGLLMETVCENSFTEENVLSSHHLAPLTSPPPSKAHLRKKQAIEGLRRQKYIFSKSDAEERLCLHCATDKTPQWRTGPMGPKTLCNACGVRYKSGRLVPEYRPAASPTFVLTKHSNSHRKIMELRRQKEMTRVRHEFLHHNHDKSTAMIVDISSNGHDYLIHHNVSPEFRELI